MNRRHKKRTPRGQGEASRNAQPGKLQADSRLRKLLETSLLLPGVHIVEIPGTTKVAVTEDCWLIALAIRERCQELGGRPMEHIERAMDAIVQVRPG